MGQSYFEWGIRLMKQRTPDGINVSPVAIGRTPGNQELEASKSFKQTHNIKMSLKNSLCESDRQESQCCNSLRQSGMLTR
jgi:hypothetical protein